MDWSISSDYIQYIRRRIALKIRYTAAISFPRGYFLASKHRGFTVLSCKSLQGLAATYLQDIYNQEAYTWTYWHGCGVEPVRNPVVSVPCLTCRTARTFTTLARRGTYLTPQLRVKCFIYTSQEHKIYPCVFGKRSLPVITSLLMQWGRTASYPFSFPTVSRAFVTAREVS